MRPDEIELEMPRRPAAEQEEGLAVAAGVVEPELYRSRIDETTCAERQSPRPPVSSRQADPASHSPRVISFGVLNDEHGNGRALDQVLRPVDRHEEVPSIRCHALAPVCLVQGSNSNPAVAPGGAECWRAHPAERIGRRAAASTASRTHSRARESGTVVAIRVPEGYSQGCPLVPRVGSAPN